jgi:hypothetical protein
LLLEFFLTFARAEFALKNSGFVTGDEHSASADWNKFANALKDHFEEGRTRELETAMNYLLDNPPMRQVLRNGKLMWDANLSTNGSSTSEVIFVLVRRIRNNLFHGGKHSLEVFEDTKRTTRLIESALLILKAGISLLPQVESAYDEAVL